MVRNGTGTHVGMSQIVSKPRHLLGAEVGRILRGCRSKRRLAQIQYYVASIHIPWDFRLEQTQN